jgi:hypothetical protein
MFATTRQTLCCAAVLACLVPACAGSADKASVESPKTINAGERTVADTSKALSAQSLGAIYGFYQGCADPGLSGWTAGDVSSPSWSIVAAPGFTLPGGAPPAVLLLEGDSSSCHLVMTDVILNDSVSGSDPTDLTISGGAGMVLNNDGTYQASALQLLKAGSAIAYINATSDQPGAPFAADFNVNLDISDTLGSASASGAGSITVTTTGYPSITGVPAPDYTASVTIGDLLTDSSGLVTDAHGSVNLAFTSQEGLSSVVANGDLTGATFAQVDNAFHSGSAGSFDTTGWASNGACGGVAMDGVCPSYDISDFIEVGNTNLSSPTVKTILVQYVDANDVATYEAIKITFSAAGL